MQRRANAEIARKRSQPRRTRPWWHAVRSAFRASDMPGTAARPRRSSGTCTRPRRRRARTPRRPTGSPSMRTAPADAARVSPASAASSSLCPFPAMPAMPRISPPPTSKRRSRSRSPTPSASPGERARQSTPRRSRGRRSSGVRRSAGGAAPIIRSASVRVLSRRGSTRPTTRPSRRIVAVSQSARTSSSLWEM